MSGLVNLGGWATENSFLRRCDPRFKVGCTVAAMVVCFRIASVPGACAALAMVLALGWATENSFLRRCDPRFKVGCTVAAMVVCFRIASVPGACAALAMVLALCWLGRVRPGRLLAAVWPLLAMLVFVSALNLFVTQTGNLLVQWGPLRITTGGVDTFALYSVRLATLLGFGTLLLATTDPLGLTNALASLLSPLKVLRVPVEQLAMVLALALRFVPTLADELQSVMDAQRCRGASFDRGSPRRRVGALTALAMVLALALRFVPTLADELQSVMDAQRCRGASFDRGSPRRRVGALTALAIPVMTWALRHADTLSLALEARAYDPSAPRTRWRAPHPGWRDAALIALTTAFVGVVLAWG